MSPLLKKHNFDLVFDSQTVFRNILKAMERPGRKVSIREQSEKLFGDYPSLLAVAVTLLDNETTFHVCGNGRLAEDISSLTLSNESDVTSADFVFVCNPEDVSGVIESVKGGTLDDPHKSASVVVFDGGESDCLNIGLRGPGINGSSVIPAARTVRDALAERDMRADEYPEGIELIFISSSSDLMVIPRTTIVEEA